MSDCSGVGSLAALARKQEQATKDVGIWRGWVMNLTWHEGSDVSEEASNNYLPCSWHTQISLLGCGHSACSFSISEPNGFSNWTWHVMSLQWPTFCHARSYSADNWPMWGSHPITCNYCFIWIQPKNDVVVVVACHSQFAFIYFMLLSP